MGVFLSRHSKFMIPQTLGSKPQSHGLKTQLSSDYQMNDFRLTTKEFLLLGSPLLLKTLSCRFLILVKPGVKLGCFLQLIWWRPKILALLTDSASQFVSS